MRESQGTITPFQLFCLIHLSMVGVGVLTLARDAGAIAGRGALISVVLAGALTGVQHFGIYLLVSRFPSQTLVEFVPTILGKYVGWLYLSVFLLIKGGFMILVGKTFWFLVNSWVLRNTPMVVFLWLLGGLAWLLNRRGLVVMARMGELIFLLLQPIWLLALVAGYELDLANLRPLFDEGVVAVLQATIPVYFAMAGFELLLFVYPFSTPKAALSAGLWGIGFSTLIYIVVVFLSIGVLGLPIVLIKVWPSIEILTTIVLPVIERIDTLFIFYWTLQIVMTITVIMYMNKILLKGIIGRRLPTHAAADLVGLAFFVGAAWPVSFDRVQSLINALGMASFVWAASSPWALWLIAVLRKKGAKDKKSARKAA